MPGFPGKSRTGMAIIVQIFVGKVLFAIVFPGNRLYWSGQ